MTSFRTRRKRVITKIALTITLGCGVFSVASQLQILQKPISFSENRKALTLEYIRQHYDPKATSIQIKPIMIVVHWTGSSSFDGAWNTFNQEILQGRADIAKAGRLGTSAHYLVARDGKPYQLMPETLMARHVIGLNRQAIGIENVGSGNLTDAQLETNALLIADIAKRFKIQYVIGHFEYGRFRNSKLWEELDKTYFTGKTDPGVDFMKRLRTRLAQLELQLRDRP
jgi:N-acetylmuramoyl-L-alanine amidase